jgi:putative two-component system response regulator
VLREEYRVACVENGEAAIEWVRAGNRPDLVLLDVLMPRRSGFEVCAELKGHPATSSIPVIFITGLNRPEDEEKGLELGAADFIHKPFSPSIVLARVGNQLAYERARRELRDRNEDLERLVASRTLVIRRQSEELRRRHEALIHVQEATIAALCTVAETRDNESGNHIRRSQHYVRTLAEGMRDHARYADELDDVRVATIYQSAALHDIGKIAIPDAVLLKPDKLTPTEWVVMRRHCEHGRDILARAAAEFEPESTPFLVTAMEIAWCHHERWDGSGYPRGLVGEAIPLPARLMAIADVYDSLMTRRSYREPCTHEQAVAIIRDEAARFDPLVYDVFMQSRDRFRVIYESLPEPA